MELLAETMLGFSVRRTSCRLLAAMTLFGMACTPSASDPPPSSPLVSIEIDRFGRLYGALTLVFSNDLGALLTVEMESGRHQEALEIEEGHWSVSASSETGFEWRKDFLADAGRTIHLEISGKETVSTVVSGFVKSEIDIPVEVLVDGVSVGEVLSTWRPTPFEDDPDGSICDVLRTYFMDGALEGKAVVVAVPLGSEKSIELQSASRNIKETILGDARECFAAVILEPPG